MINRLLRFGLLMWVLVALVVPGSASAQSGPRYGTHRYEVSLLGGLGGSTDVDFTNPTFQLGWSLITERDTEFGVRIGKIGFGSNDLVGDLLGPDLTYITLGGEYRFQETYYSSGMFLGLGYYDIDGHNIGTGENGDSGFGLHFGINGDFDINDRWSVIVELAAHWADLGPENFFATGLTGLSLKF